ncbi:hypothetical protein F7725_021834 [Dissostichus mawsoni]|uniref:Solute carrier family 25 member 3 n=1 Tax=Dissostichus mawsoni TaxID=36200 RepID=A0A7J5ZCB7_DISMA|nr:hypothetical protein F7725_021834 [Dissostichus mawsoni]
MVLSESPVATKRRRHLKILKDSASRQDTTMYPTALTQLARGNPFSSPLFNIQKVEEPKQSLHGQKTRTLAAAATSDEGAEVEFGSQKYFLLCGFGGILSCGTTHTAVVPLDLIKCRLQYYALCGFGGILSCGLTHTAMVPLDLVKCRLQVDPEKFKSIGNGFRLTVREDGVRGLAKGWAPTFIGYSMQGLCKFGFYEVFKENTYLWRTSLYLAASASAEFFADIALAPMEAVKVRIQTKPGYANTLRECVPKMYAEEGGVVPLWMRQIPYTMMKFSCFERTVELLYKHAVPKPRSECTKSEQLVVTFVAGYIAGVFCAIVSHPADSVVSVLNKESGSTATQVLKKLGPKVVHLRLRQGLLPPAPPRPPEMPESLKKKLGLTE